MSSMVFLVLKVAIGIKIYHLAVLVLKCIVGTAEFKGVVIAADPYIKHIDYMEHYTNFTQK